MIFITFIFSESTGAQLKHIKQPRIKNRHGMTFLLFIRATFYFSKYIKYDKYHGLKKQEIIKQNPEQKKSCRMYGEVNRL